MLTSLGLGTGINRLIAAQAPEDLVLRDSDVRNLRTQAIIDLRFDWEAWERGGPARSASSPAGPHERHS